MIWQVQRLKEQEAEDGLSSRPRRPKALILGPTRELTDQILRVAKSISHHAKFRSTCVNGGAACSLQAVAVAFAVGGYIMCQDDCKPTLPLIETTQPEISVLSYGHTCI